MNRDRILALRDHYRAALLDDVVPFWTKHSLDREYGGYLTCLDREGAPYGTDKAMWLQARQVWMFSKLYNTVERRPEWLDVARLGYDFMRRYGFDTDGRMFFTVTRDGQPLRKRRYLFTETFGVIACAEYARATGDADALRCARDTYRLLIDLHRTPGSLPPKVYPETRATKALAMPMILLATTLELVLVDQDPLYDQVMDEAADEIVRDFLKRDERALHETVGPNGERLDTPEGRCLCPGHDIETAWFMLALAEHRGGDRELVDIALDIIRWALDWGWDKEHGGLLYYVDCEGRPPEQLEWDMKLWWPHNEALYAVLWAHKLTGDPAFEAWYERLHEWSFAHFPDREHGEWYGYLHRDGSPALTAKGTIWKGAFHVPRGLWLCYTLLECWLEEEEF